MAGGDQFDAFGVNLPGQNGRGCRAVAGHVGGLTGDFFDHLRAHVFEFVFELDFFGDGNAVFGDSSARRRIYPVRHCGPLGPRSP